MKQMSKENSALKTFLMSHSDCGHIDETNIWVTSDTHFWHKNVISYDNRPFADVVEMNDELIRRWNEVVPTNGFVIVVGDFIFAGSGKMDEILKKLNGIKILIRGNHDLKSEYVYTTNGRFSFVSHYGIEYLDDICFKHIPIYESNGIPQRDDNGWYARQLEDIKKNGIKKIIHGHLHNSVAMLDENFIQYNVGCCLHDYTPVRLDKIQKYFNDITNKEWDSYIQ